MLLLKDTIFAATLMITTSYLNEILGNSTCGLFFISCGRAAVSGCMFKRTL